LKPLEDKLRKRQDKGRYWWELRSCAYYEAFQKPKYLIQGIAFHPRISFDSIGTYVNNAAFILPSSDLWTLAVLNSPIIWCFIFRNLPHKKDEAIAMDAVCVESLPIAPPTDEIRSQVEAIATRLIEITKANQQASREVMDWLHVEQAIEKLGQKLEDFASLDCDQFVQEVKTRKPKNSGLNPKALKELREVYNDYAPNIQAHRTEALILETRLSDLVNQAYGLTPEEIDLMWKTAPPRMPITKAAKKPH